MTILHITGSDLIRFVLMDELRSLAEADLERPPSNKTARSSSLMVSFSNSTRLVSEWLQPGNSFSTRKCLCWPLDSLDSTFPFILQTYQSTHCISDLDFRPGTHITRSQSIIFDFPYKKKTRGKFSLSLHLWQQYFSSKKKPILQHQFTM